MRWAPDPQFCFRCDRDLPLDEHGNRTAGLKYCDECRAIADAIYDATSDQEPPTYRGTVALGVSLDGWPTDLTLLAMDVWDRFIELRTAETPRRSLSPPPPRAMGGAPLGDRPPHQWVVTTDVGTTHHGMAGGGGTPGTDKLLEGTHTLVPSLPADASRIVITAAAPGASATITAQLDGWPAEIRRAAVEISTTIPTGNPDCPSCGPPPPLPPPAEENDTTSMGLEWAMEEPPPPRQDACHVEDKRPLCGDCRSVTHDVLAAKRPQTKRPHRVIAVSTDLGDVFGSHLHVPSIETWTTWFDLTLVGDHNGPLFELIRSVRRARCWSAQDDRGGGYQGMQVAGRSDPSLVGIMLTFAPALHPEARALTVRFPASFGGSAALATIALPT